MADSIVKIEDGRINFCCKMDYCVNSCCGPFSGITSLIGNIEKRPFNEIVLTSADYKRIYESGYQDFIEDGYSEHMSKGYKKMSLESDGTCRAFVDGKCCISDIKPTLCRAFPFYFDMFSGLCAIDCEGFSDDYWTDVSDYRGYFEAARKMYKFWIDFYSGESEL